MSKLSYRAIPHPHQGNAWAIESRYQDHISTSYAPVCRLPTSHVLRFDTQDAAEQYIRVVLLGGAEPKPGKWIE